MCERADWRAAFQRTLADDGVPLVWLIDVGVDDPAFCAVQRLAVGGVLPLGEDLLFGPKRAVSAGEWQAWGGDGVPPRDRASAAVALCKRAGHFLDAD